MNNVLYYLMLFLMVAAPFFWLRAAKDFSWKKAISELLPKRVAWRKEVFGAVKLFALLFAAFVILSTALNFAGINDLEKVNESINLDASAGAIPFAVTIGIVVFIEEFFFRAFLQKRVGIFPSTALFTLLHWGYGSIAELIGVLALGLILAYWYKKHNSLIQNYLGHIIYDIVAIAMYLAV